LHFQRSRPVHGFCYLDFVEEWLWQALYRQRDPDAAYKHARELAHWALLMHPDLAPTPRNVVLGEN
jgi:hypothetical protein